MPTTTKAEIRELETRKLIKKAHAGDLDARNDAIQLNLGLAQKLASKYRSREDFEDILQIAYLALTSAVERFDTESKNKFSTFAYTTIWGEIANYFRDNTSLVRRKTSHYLYKKIQDFEYEYYKINGRYPTIEETAIALNEEPLEIESVIKENQPIYYLSSKGKEDDTSDDNYSEFADSLAGQNSEDYTNSIVIQETLKKVLTEDEIRIVNYKMQKLNAKEISNEMGLSAIKVRREWTKISEKLSRFLLTYGF